MQSHPNWITALAFANSKSDVKSALALIGDITTIEFDLINPTHYDLVRVNFNRIFHNAYRYMSHGDEYNTHNPRFNEKCRAILNGLLIHWIRETNPTVKNKDLEAGHLVRHVLTRRAEATKFNSQIKKAVLDIQDVIRFNMYGVPLPDLKSACRDAIDDDVQRKLLTKNESFDRLFAKIANLRHLLPPPTTDEHPLRLHTALTGVLDAIIDLKTCEVLGVSLSAFREGLDNNSGRYIKARREQHDHCYKLFQHDVLASSNRIMSHLCTEYQNHLRRLLSSHPVEAPLLEAKIRALGDLAASLSLNGDAKASRERFKELFSGHRKLLETQADDHGKAFLKAIRSLIPTPVIGTFFPSQEATTPTAAVRNRRPGLFDRRDSVTDEHLTSGGSKNRRQG